MFHIPYPPFIHSTLLQPVSSVAGSHCGRAVCGEHTSLAVIPKFLGLDVEPGIVSLYGRGVGILRPAVQAVIRSVDSEISVCGCTDC